ncbi:unnamed protein product, partial [Durusdinium trenchii]
DWRPLTSRDSNLCPHDGDHDSQPQEEAILSQRLEFPDTQDVEEQLDSIMDSLEKELPEVPLPPPSMPQLPSPPRDRAADGEDAHPAPVPGQASSGGENGSKLDQEIVVDISDDEGMPDKPAAPFALPTSIESVIMQVLQDRLDPKPERASFMDPMLLLSDSMLPSAGPYDETQLPCSPNQLMNSDVALETVRSVEKHDQEVENQ